MSEEKNLLEVSHLKQYFPVHQGFKTIPLKAVDDISFAIKPGETLGLVGESGCGKTTLINLIMRFYDVTGGEIDMDGKPSKLLERRSLRKNIGMVLQETWVRKASVKENVAIGKPDATQAEIEEACKRAHCHGFISRLPTPPIVRFLRFS